MTCTAHEPVKRRCAIYTRKSTQHGLEQEFNSLDHQRAVCSAYIASQSHKGWLEVAKTYEDAPYSGATLDRPALRDLLRDVENGHVDVIVLYKLDRISRSLPDFMRLLELFDRYGVTFVCITQSFDTSDSLGRLVMNVLLTFAQFEREITSDRIKDKLRALARKGIWVGSRPPFGYDRVDHKLIVNDHEAAIIRWIYTRYCELRSTNALWNECRERNVTSRPRVTKDGRVLPARLMPFASLRSILLNSVYVGMVKNAGRLYPGNHEPIVPRELWERAQSIRSENAQPKACPIVDLLPRLVWDSFGRLMSVHRMYKKTGCFRHYVSRPDKWGQPSALKRTRAPADELESLVVAALQALLLSKERVRTILLDVGRYGGDVDRIGARGPVAAWRLSSLTREHLRQILRTLILRVEISATRAKIVIRSSELVRFLEWDGLAIFTDHSLVWNRSETHLIDVPASAARIQRGPIIPCNPRSLDSDRKPKRSLVALIREARRAQSLMDENRSETLSSLAKRLRRRPSFFAKALRLNYLAPDIIGAILDGSQPDDLTRKVLLNSNIPMDWETQRTLLGFGQPG
jgi:DNA invertase Pin-like site-specific DNA recombinase